MISPCVISVSVPRNCTCYFMSFCPLLGQSIVICLFVYSLPVCHLPAHSLGYTNHPLLLGPLWSARRGCPFFQASSSPHLVKLLVLHVSLFLFRTALLHTKVGPPAAACPIPSGLTHTSFALLLENLLFPLSDLCPEDIKSSLWVCLRDCSVPGNKESIFIATVELRKAIQGHMEVGRRVCTELVIQALCPVCHS